MILSVSDSNKIIAVYEEKNNRWYLVIQVDETTTSSWPKAVKKGRLIGFESEEAALNFRDSKI